MKFNYFVDKSRIRKELYFDYSSRHNDFFARGDFSVPILKSNFPAITVHSSHGRLRSNEVTYLSRNGLCNYLCGTL